LNCIGSARARRIAAGAVSAALLLGFSTAGPQPGLAAGWNLADAAAPYKGTTINVVVLDRPSYVAEKQLIPQFEKETGITVKTTTYPYESALKAETLNFVSNSNQYDGILADLIWTGTFAHSKWVVPMSTFTNNPKLADPALDLNDFFPVWLDAFKWDNVLYGIPFDSYSGLLYYNTCMFKKAGFTSPPTTWNELLTKYGPKLTNKAAGTYAYALQSLRGETQTADSFSRFLWDFGGSWYDAKTYQPQLDSPGAIKGMEFRASLAPIMPPGIVSDDHAQVVQLMAQGKVAMITEWSSFYTTLNDPSTSKIRSCLAVGKEPAGPSAADPAFGGFAYMVSSQSPQAKQEATYLFVQWLASKAVAPQLINKGAVVARKSADTDPAMMKKYPYLAPMVAQWAHSNPDWRPRIPQYPQMSEVVANYGSQIQQGALGIQPGLAKINDEIKGILQQGGYLK
jgi:multiple sugar transport system substrate-binding protein